MQLSIFCVDSFVPRVAVGRAASKNPELENRGPRGRRGRLASNGIHFPLRRRYLSRVAFGGSPGRLRGCDMATGCSAVGRAPLY